MTLPVQSTVACCLAHFLPARSQPKNSTLPASSAIHLLRPSLLPLRPPFTSFGRASSRFALHSPPSAATLPASHFIHPLRPRLLPLRPPFTPFGRASRFARHSLPSAEPPVLLVIHPLRPHLFRLRPSFTPFGRLTVFEIIRKKLKNRHSRLDWEDGHNIRQAAFALHTWAGRWAARQGGGQKRARSRRQTGKVSFQPRDLARAIGDSVLSSAFSAGKVSTQKFDLAGFVRHSPPSAEPPPAEPPPASSAIHLLRPHLLRFRPSFTPFGRTSSRFVRHSPPSAAPLPVSSVIPGWVGKRVITFGVFPYLCRI